MIREETTGHGAEYVIFYIWGDDPTRSLLRSRYCAIYPWFKFDSDEETARNFHGQFWAHVEIDPQSGKFIEESESTIHAPISVPHDGAAVIAGPLEK
jgi:hypothetical protein